MFDALVCIDTQTGRCTRYVRTMLFGIPMRSAGSVEFQNYHPCRPIAFDTIDALEKFREQWSL